MANSRQHAGFRGRPRPPRHWALHDAVSSARPRAEALEPRLLLARMGPEPFYDVWATDFVAEKLHAIGHAIALRVLGPDRIAATTSEGLLLVIDLVAGKLFRAGRAPPEAQLFGAGDTIVFNAGTWYALTLPVPVEAAALRAWLATATNARVVADNVVQWP